MTIKLLIVCLGDLQQSVGGFPVPARGARPKHPHLLRILRDQHVELLDHQLPKQRLLIDGAVVLLALMRTRYPPSELGRGSATGTSTPISTLATVRTEVRLRRSPQAW